MKTRVDFCFRFFFLLWKNGLINPTNGIFKSSLEAVLSSFINKQRNKTLSQHDILHEKTAWKNPLGYVVRKIKNTLHFHHHLLTGPPHFLAWAPGEQFSSESESHLTPERWVMSPECPTSILFHTVDLREPTADFQGLLASVAPGAEKRSSPFHYKPLFTCIPLFQDTP